MAELTLYYDGECPICRSYRDYVAVRRTVDLQLRDARQHLAEIETLAEAGHDINAGMILVTGEGTLQGADVIVALPAYTLGRGVGDAVLRSLVKAPWLVRAGYLLARRVRHLLLHALGRNPRIHA